MQAIHRDLSGRGTSVHVRVSGHNATHPELHCRVWRCIGTLGYKGQRQRPGGYSSHQIHTHRSQGQPGECVYCLCLLGFVLVCVMVALCYYITCPYWPQTSPILLFPFPFPLPVPLPLIRLPFPLPLPLPLPLFPPPPFLRRE